MEVYKNKVFDRWAKKENLNSRALCKAVHEMNDGLYEADLGGGLLKKRVARDGKGKSGGFRTLVATNRKGRWIFLFGFSKNERSNIDKDEEEALKKLADELLPLTTKELEKVLIKVDCNKKN